jgi:hypothetical protein
MTLVGLPHSEIPGSKRACRSPRHIAACHVLHRLSVPRHPPSTLSNLTIKCLDLMRSAASCLIDTSLHSLYLPIFNCQRTTGREDQRCTQSPDCGHRSSDRLRPSPAARFASLLVAAVSLTTRRGSASFRLSRDAERGGRGGSRPSARHA